MKPRENFYLKEGIVSAVKQNEWELTNVDSEI